MGTASVISIVIIILLVYIVVRILWRKQYSGSITSGTTQQIINSSQLKSSSGSNESTYSIWVNIDNWNDFYGQKKVILSRGHTGTATTKISSTYTENTGNIPKTYPSFELYLDEYGNNLVAKSLMLRNQPGGYKYIDKFIQADGLSGSGTPTNNLVFNKWVNNVGITGYQIGKACDIACDGDVGCIGYTYDTAWGSNCGLIGTKNNTPPILAGTFIDYPVLGGTGFSAIKNESFYHTCKVPKIPTQQWVNIIVSISTVSVDMYLDGKLIKTCITNGELATNDFDIVLSPNGVGFTGWNAKFQYWPKYISPKDAWNIYKKGYQKTFDIRNYSLSLGVYKGNVKKTSVTI
jgi:hypothetical protein